MKHTSLMKTKDDKEVDLEMGMRSSAENKIQEATLAESACVDGEKVFYEFLVKWALLKLNFT